MKTVVRQGIGIVLLLGASLSWITAWGRDEPLNQPGHAEILRKGVGTWTATSRFYHEEGTDPTVATGVETLALVSGERWLRSEFRGELGGQPYERHGFLGYDPQSKKFKGAWVDSARTRLTTAEGTYDPRRERLTLWAERRDPELRKLALERHVVVFKEDGSRRFIMSIQDTRSEGELSTLRKLQTLIDVRFDDDLLAPVLESLQSASGVRIELTKEGRQIASRGERPIRLRQVRNIPASNVLRLCVSAGSDGFVCHVQEDKVLVGPAGAMPVGSRPIPRFKKVLEIEYSRQK